MKLQFKKKQMHIAGEESPFDRLIDQSVSSNTGVRPVDSEVTWARSDCDSRALSLLMRKHRGVASSAIAFKTTFILNSEFNRARRECTFYAKSNSVQQISDLVVRQVAKRSGLKLALYKVERTERFFRNKHQAQGGTK
jgi:hypothetical protein